MARVELNEQNLEDVVGGAFQFYNKDGQGYCRVTKTQGGGTFTCNEGAVHDFIDMKSANPGHTAEEYLQMALDQGILHRP